MIGRPRVLVDIEFLRGLHFSIEEEGISHETCYSDLSNADLDRLVQEIKRMHPNDGERLMIGHRS